ncbi:MAG: ATP-binding cassette domain-containing protein [Oscillospiraceae bacterium]|nr:ATP-binding cassette domain-containing protein [Oscillospiraceae bacterium]
MIEFNHLSKSYPTASGVIPALNDVNLTIADGEIFGIIGLSGAGKSTLVRCINLLERPTAGEVLLDGQSMTALHPASLRKMRASIGMIFQGFCLLEQRTVLKNVCFPLELAGVAKADATARAMELLALVGLSDRANAYPAQLSGGQKQRVAIARALATKPRYLLCDEATSALDPNTTASILDLLEQINRTLGVTIVVITHEMPVIERICSRVAVLHNSRIVESGPVSAVFSHPQSDIAREMILPASCRCATTGRKLRLIFDGAAASSPVVAAMILACQTPINILFADTREIDTKAYGHMVVQLPEDDVQAKKILAWLSANRITYCEEGAL